MIVGSTAVSVSELSAPKRLSIALDPGLVLERLILRRLADLPRKRGQDWLRSLLVLGFLAEGRWLRPVASGGDSGREPHASAIPATPFARWLERAHANGRTDHEPALHFVAASMTPPPANGSDKPFAHLRKVIG